jgi:N6-adenosine-specific RNA methylase IME4
MSECEICLIGKKGNIPSPRGARNIRQFLSEQKTKHSSKPQEIRKRIEMMFPEQNKVELFARQKIEGWDVWGNEVESDITL